MRTSSIEATDLAVQVRQRRQELGLSQLELAERSSMSAATIGRIERGAQVSLRSTTLRQLDQALNWPVGQARHYTDGTPLPDVVEDLVPERQALMTVIESDLQRLTTAQLQRVISSLTYIRDDAADAVSVEGTVCRHNRMVDESDPGYLIERFDIAAGAKVHRLWIERQTSTGDEFLAEGDQVRLRLTTNSITE